MSNMRELILSRSSKVKKKQHLAWESFSLFRLGKIKYWTTFSIERFFLSLNGLGMSLQFYNPGQNRCLYLCFTFDTQKWAKRGNYRYLFCSELVYFLFILILIFMYVYYQKYFLRFTTSIFILFCYFYFISLYFYYYFLVFKYMSIFYFISFIYFFLLT